MSLTRSSALLCARVFDGNRADPSPGDQHVSIIAIASDASGDSTCRAL